MFGIVIYLRYELCPKQFAGVYDFSIFSKRPEPSTIQINIRKKK